MTNALLTSLASVAVAGVGGAVFVSADSKHDGVKEAARAFLWAGILCLTYELVFVIIGGRAH